MRERGCSDPVSAMWGALGYSRKWGKGDGLVGCLFIVACSLRGGKIGSCGEAWVLCGFWWGWVEVFQFWCILICDFVYQPRGSYVMYDKCSPE